MSYIAQVSVVSKYNCNLELRRFCCTAFCDWFRKTRVTCLITNQMQKRHQSRVGHVLFSALGTGHIFLFGVFVDSLIVVNVFNP